MKNRKINFLSISLFSTAIVVLFYFGIDFIVELWWFESLDYTVYFALREGYRDTITAIVSIILVSIFYLNFRVAAKFSQLGTALLDANTDSSNINPTQGRFPNKYYLLLSLLLAIPILIPVYQNWETILLFFFSAPSGVVDPAYGKDISYYLFSYPVYQLIQTELLIVFSLLILLVSGFYWLAHKSHKDKLRLLSKKAKIHLTLLILVLIMLQAWSIALERIDLLYENRHLPNFFGPGAVEMQFQLPLIWMSYIAFLGAACSAIYYIHKHQGRKFLVGFSIAYLVILISRQISFIPELIDDYIVKPNPVKAESQFMQFNIDATLNAFGLHQVRKIQYPAISSLTPGVSTEISNTLNNIPLWESHLLAEVYEQLQEIRPYYDFSAIATDRYLLDDTNYQVNIAAREISTQKLPAETNSWENRHLIYTHGYGTVIKLAAQQANEPKQWLLKNLSLETQYDALRTKDPEIYYGTGSYEYAIVPNSTPSSLANVKELNPDYQGTGGLRITSIIRKLILASFLNEQNLIFSTSLTSKSRLLIRRNINDRIHAIAPFLQLEPNPVPAIINNKIYWIVDAYTTSQRYPLVEPIASPFNNFKADYNYIRNSVKIIVDAYNGSVEFYIVDHNDPIIAAYSRAYPSLFKKTTEIPSEFIRHFSYPVTLFNQQMEIYSRYHDTDPSVFYQQNKRLAVAKFDNQPVQPIFLLIDPFEDKSLPASDEKKFVLANYLTPYSRENLGMIFLAGCLIKDNCNEQYSADIFAYQIAKELQIEGPSQIEALIDQTPEISAQFTMWNQQGSKVIKGSIIIIPIEELILYIQPIYLSATSKTGFLSLSRVIIAMNHEVVMDTSLELAYKKLEAILLMKQNSGKS